LIPILLAAAAAVANPAAPNPVITGAPRHESAPPSRDACPDLITPDALVCRAMAADKAGNSSAAAQAFEEAAKASSGTDARTARMWAAAGNMWIAADQAAKAAADFDKALAIPALDGVQRGEALLDRARAAQATGDYATARARVTDAAKLIAGDPFVWLFSAALAIREGDHGTAQSAIGQALSLAPKDPSVLFEAGHVALFNGEDDQARSYWRRAQDGDPGGPIGRSAAKAIEVLGVTPTVSNNPTPAKPVQPKS
jgi:tetratricopeptide (TPR) repeat protein